LASTDPLTGIANRRRFMDAAQVEFARARRSGAPLSLLSIDLDHFKTINDTWGHEAGDAVLQHFTRSTRALLREYDLFARMGGDEFVVLLPYTSSADAERTANRILSTARQQRVAIGNADIQYTISIGHSTVDDEYDLESLLRRADSALYKAKSAGRGCVACA